MSKKANSQPTVVRTERGLSVAGTRITIYNVIDLIKAGWSTKLISDRLNLTKKQVADVLDYIETHRQEVETEYQLVLKQAKENRKYWETQSQKLFSGDEVTSGRSKQEENFNRYDHNFSRAGQPSNLQKLKR